MSTRIFEIEDVNAEGVKTGKKLTMIGISKVVDGAASEVIRRATDAEIAALSPVAAPVAVKAAHAHAPAKTTKGKEK